MLKLNLDYNHIFILESFNDPDDLEQLRRFELPNLKFLSLSTAYQHLAKNDFLVQDPNDSEKLMLSVKGKNVLEDLQVSRKQGSLEFAVIDVSKTPEEQFEEWWKAFPTTPRWKSDDGTMTFTGSRTLRNEVKATAKKKYLKLLNQGLKHEDLMGALAFEIKEKKTDSIKKNQNQMEFFKGMQSYFNSERYLMYMEKYKEDPGYVTGTSVLGKKQNVKDI